MSATFGLVSRAVVTSEIILKEPWYATVKRYAVLGYGAAGSAFALALLVIGVLMVGLAFPVLLAGFGLVEVEDGTLSTGPLLISALILGVAGGFFLGIASESPLGRGRRLQGYKIWEVGIGRTLAVVVIGFGLLFVYRVLSGAVGDIPYPLYKGLETIRATGAAGMIAMPFIGVPLSLLVRSVPTQRPWVNRLDNPAMFLVWFFAALMNLT